MPGNGWCGPRRILTILRSARRASAEDTARFANESIIQKLIPVMDNFEMALGKPEGGGHSLTSDLSTSDLRALLAGIAMIQQQLKAVLTDAGVAEVDATGQPFDPQVHEAVSEQESARSLQGVRDRSQQQHRLCRRQCGRAVRRHARRWFA